MSQLLTCTMQFLNTSVECLYKLICRIKSETFHRIPTKSVFVCCSFFISIYLQDLGRDSFDFVFNFWRQYCKVLSNLSMDLKITMKFYDHLYDKLYNAN